MTSAIVFVLSQYLLPDAQRCIDYCLSHGYHVVGVVKDQWSEAVRMLADGTASVVVVADRQHIDPERTPRMEVVAERPAGPGRAAARPRNERTRALRRTAGG